METISTVESVKGIELNGLSDQQVIALANALLEAAGVRDSDMEPITDRADALLALFTLAKSAEAFGARSIFVDQLEAGKADLAARAA